METTWSEAGDAPEHAHTLHTFGLKNQSTYTHTLTLIQIIESIFESIEKQEKYSIKITTENLSIVERLTKLKPQYFKIVENTFTKYVKEGSIDANHVPYIISLIQQLYMLLLKHDLQPIETTADVCRSIAEFLFSVVIREQLSDIEDETMATLLILCCTNILDSCIHLIKLEAPRKKQIEIQAPQRTYVESPPVVPQKSGCCY